MKVVRTVALAVMVAGFASQMQGEKLSYPGARKSSVLDDYHGTRIADPYRWMEDIDAKEVTEWVERQNRLTSGYLERLPLRAHFRKRITELWNYPKTGLPIRQAGRLFYSKNSGLQRQAPVYLREDLAAEPKLVIDPNALSPDGTVSLGQYAPSPDGRLIAYTLSQGGADWRSVHVREIASGHDLPDKLEWMRFSDLSWTKDAKGFFYARYPEPPKGQALEAALKGHAVYYHRVGTPQSADRLIYERKDLPDWVVGGSTTEDKRYLLVFIAKGSGRTNRLYYADLGDPDRPNVAAAIKPVVETDDAEYLPIGNRGSMIYVKTDRDAPNRKVVAIDLQQPAPSAWKTIVPERNEAIEEVAVIGGRVVAQYLVDVQSRLALFDLDGQQQGEIALPAAGTVASFGGREDMPEIFYMFSSPIYPTTVFRYDPDARRSTAFEAAKPPVDISQYETKALFARSKDGTRIPFFLTARKELPRNGANPTMLYGYGGFSVSTLPRYRSDVPAWLEMGGIWVTANMRGGAEYGEAWHKAGMLEKKQNVFDDFIAVAEHLIAEKYTSPAKLGIMGASNGGLLVGAVMEQRPDLFAAVLPAVGVMDMLRYDRFTGGHFWAAEYGTSGDAGQFKCLIRYSPLHNIKPGACYPATLVTTADHDDRVVPSHSYKFTAALQSAQGCDKPTLIRVETQGSHGYRPTDKQIAELADQWAFTAAQMGITTPGTSTGER